MYQNSIIIFHGYTFYTSRIISTTYGSITKNYGSLFRGNTPPRGKPSYRTIKPVVRSQIEKVSAKTGHFENTVH